MANIMQDAAIARLDAIRMTSDEKRSEFAQHLTPPETAKLAVSMFSELEPEKAFIKCLDLGAGTGMLSVALYDRYDGHIEKLDAIEMDESLATIFEAEMASVGVPHELVLGDALTDTPSRLYDRVILNPPYKKMGARDSRQALLPCHAANLYSAFISIGLSRLAENGELVAIVPRSWMNGDYFTPFRRYALGFFSLDAIHVYGSRSEVFEDTKVLQETMLVRFSNRKQCEFIKVTQSIGKNDDIEEALYKSSDLIDPFSLVVRIAPHSGSGSCETLGEVGLCPSTGKVVDFRSRDCIFDEKPDGKSVYSLLYAGNFVDGEIIHPRDIGKPQWFVADDVKAVQQLTQPGFYVVVKRFSSKEERRRVTAYPIEVSEPIALENHLNFIHAGTPRNVVPLRSEGLSRGLALWLNSTYIDEWFRDVSGSTQVNAKDIKSMPCPSIETLQSLGRFWEPGMDQSTIDAIIESVK